MPATKIRTALRTVGLVWDEYFTAAVNMSAACAAYKFVQPGSIFGEVSFAAGGACAQAIGILQNSPAAAGQARVRVMGKSIVAACIGACVLVPGTFVQVGSFGGAAPTGCGVAQARWAGSAVSSCATYGEVYLLGPSFSSCISAAC